MFNSHRWSELDLAQSEEILAILAQVSKPSNSNKKYNYHKDRNKRRNRSRNYGIR